MYAIIEDSGRRHRGAPDTIVYVDPRCCPKVRTESSSTAQRPARPSGLPAAHAAPLRLHVNDPLRRVGVPADGRNEVEPPRYVQCQNNGWLSLVHSRTHT